MGGQFSWFGYTGRTDDPDPVTGLTSRDKYLIKTSWDIIKKDLTSNGVKIVCLYLEKYPEEIQLFPFRDIPPSEFKDSKRFQAHCNSIMYALTSMVDNLDDTELLLLIIEKIRESHKKRNVTKQSFDRVLETLLEVFAKISTKETLDSWTKGLNVIFKVLTEV